jgi:hypothetical protein
MNASIDLLAIIYSEGAARNSYNSMPMLSKGEFVVLVLVSSNTYNFG